MPLTAIVLKELIDYSSNITKIIPTSLSYETAQGYLGNLITNNTTSYSASPQIFNLYVNAGKYWTTPTLAIPSVMNVLSTVSNDSPILFLVKFADYAKSIFLCNDTTILGVMELPATVAGSTTGMPLYLPTITLKGE